ncbi:MAG: hypothetical protein DRR16_04670 [Candidatus Parabeggiatoa sp. nov. 3]|nr:MAG: hypothetical protein DRR00_17385 [Gammaproteobacteria bacterium]RKZ57956.1 MAG: hypothetical protein DRQ99_26145 [Gammaproteobacteria bacterium]RKZ88570.1 MAG: hypothetical protein DRR16_04670 [Gammaproteobacteria bacterium]HEW97401.1 hypothetical protein [Beggiatoa sp.]
MGFRVLLIAVKGKKQETVHNDYSVVTTDKYESIPESDVTGVLLPSGAYLLYINDEIIPDENVFYKLSKNAYLIACYVNETTMQSFVCSWKDGIEEWSVFHDAQQSIKHLETIGEVPRQVKSIQDKLFLKQDNCGDADYIFDIPIELFKNLGGIDYDQEIEGAKPEPWQVLSRDKCSH